MALGDFSGVIPPVMSTAIIQEATLASAALQLCNRIPMGTGVQQMPVPKTLPTASWVSAAGSGRKGYTNVGLQPAQLTAEEVAAVIAIPDKMIEDTSIDLWGYCRPLLAQAIAQALDGAVLFGVNAPASFPVGGVMAAATGVAAGVDAVDTINKCMGTVEAQGLSPDGSAADLPVRSQLRGLRTTQNALLLGETSIGNYVVPTLYGIPIAYTPFQGKTGVTPGNFVTGDWDYAILGVRQDIRYMIDPSAVIADASGVVQVSGFQDNVTPMKVWARFGFVIINPVTVLVPAGAKAFAKADTLAASGVSPTAESDEKPARSAKA